MVLYVFFSWQDWRFRLSIIPTVYLNLPVCLISFLILVLALRGLQLDPLADASYSLLRRFDFGGLAAYMTGTICIVVGFSFATANGCKQHSSDKWNGLTVLAGKAPSTIVLIILGVIILVCGSVYEAYTTRDSLFPPSMFKNLTASMSLPSSGYCYSRLILWTPVTILVIAFLHNFVFNAGTFYLALFYQVNSLVLPLTPFWLTTTRPLMDIHLLRLGFKSCRILWALPSLPCPPPGL